MGFESRAISARVTKQIVTIFSKTCDKLNFHTGAITFNRMIECFLSFLLKEKKTLHIDVTSMPMCSYDPTQ